MLLITCFVAGVKHTVQVHSFERGDQNARLTKIDVIKLCLVVSTGDANRLGRFTVMHRRECVENMTNDTVD